MSLSLTQEDARAFAQRAKDRFGVREEPGKYDAIYGPDPLEIDTYRPALSPEMIELDDPSNRERRWQTVQHLRDLGYLAEASKNPRSDELSGALQQFYRDALSFDAQFLCDEQEDIDAPCLKTGETSLPTDAVDPSRLRISYIQLRRLILLTSFDGELELQRLPLSGEVNLLSRVTLFRLRSFNLIADPKSRKRDAHTASPSDPFPVQAYQTTSDLYALLYPESVSDTAESQLSMVNQLGKVSSLTRRYLEITPESESWIATGSGGLKKRRNLGRNLRRIVKARKRFRQPLINAFALELLQTFLWMGDYYLGEVDMNWSQESRRALKRFAKAEGIKNRLLLKPSRVNARLAIEKLIQDDQSPAGNVFEAQDRIVDKLAPALDSAGVDSWTKLDTTIRSRESEQRKKGRRRYFGLRRLARSIWKFAKNAAKWVKHLLKNLFGPVLKFLRFIGRGIRMAIRIASLALKRVYLLVSKKPLLSGSINPPRLVASYHSIDNDSLLCVATEGEQSWVEKHFQILDLMNRALGWVIAIAQAAIDFAKGPMGWLKAGYRLFATIRSIFEYSPSTIFQGSMLWT